MYDPELQKARVIATLMQQKYLFNVSRTTFIQSFSKVTAILDEGFPVLLDIDFYYGAWNHRKALDYGIARNMSQWYKGIVTYPEPNSLDKKAYLRDSAGHSVLIVGYDNTIVITNREQMVDGTTKECSYTGAYIFKNSWGTESFGVAFTYNGTVYPGYGMITTKYANQYGRFFQMIMY